MTRSNRRLGWIVLSTGMVLSCSSPSSERQEPGVQAWVLGDPTLTLGSLDGENDAFSPIRNLAVDQDGQLYLLLPQEHRVAVFDEDGTFLESMGREGEGPGEFSNPWDLGFLGDTLWVMDSWARRVNLFLNSRFIGSKSLEIPRDVHPERNARAVAVLEGGGVLIVTDSQSPYDPPVTSTPSLVLVQRPGSLDTLATYSTDYTAGFVIRRSGGAISAVMPFPQPVSGGDTWAFAPDGTHIVLIKPDPVEPDQTSSHFSVTMLRSRGDTVFFTQLSYEPVRMPEEVRDDIAKELAGERFTVEEVKEAAYLPYAYPPVSAALIAQDGSVWIGREAIPDLPRRWDVLSPGGKLLATVTTAPGFDLRAVTADDAWGIVHDDYDVPYVHRRPIIRPPAG